MRHLCVLHKTKILLALVEELQIVLESEPHTGRSTSVG